jgi:hypothetical protein
MPISIPSGYPADSITTDEFYIFQNMKEDHVRVDSLEIYIQRAIYEIDENFDLSIREGAAFNDRETFNYKLAVYFEANAKALPDIKERLNASDRNQSELDSIESSSDRLHILSRRAQSKIKGYLHSEKLEVYTV